MAETKWAPTEVVPLTLAYVQTGKTVARFIDAPVGTGNETGDRHRIRMWVNKIEEAALYLLDEQPTSSGFVIVAREYFDELRHRAASPSENKPKGRALRRHSHSEGK